MYLHNLTTRPRFVGYTYHEVIFSPEAGVWQLRHVTSGDTAASYNGSQLWPTGRHTWHVAGGVCGPGHYRDLVLSRYTRE